MKKILLSGIMSFILTMTHAQTPIQYQNSNYIPSAFFTNNGYYQVSPIMEAGSDAASLDFKTNMFPVIHDTLISASLAASIYGNNHQTRVPIPMNDNPVYSQIIGPGNSIVSTGTIPLNVVPHISFTTTTQVRAYFIGEVAGYHNALVYQKLNATDQSILSKGLVFSDSSKYSSPRSVLPTDTIRSSTDPLSSGDFVDLGVFEPGELLRMGFVSQSARHLINGNYIYLNVGENSLMSDHLFFGSSSENFDGRPHIRQIGNGSNLFTTEDISYMDQNDYTDTLFYLSYTEIPAAVPEVETWSLSLMGLLALIIYRKRFSKAKTSN